MNLDILSTYPSIVYFIANRVIVLNIIFGGIGITGTSICLVNIAIFSSDKSEFAESVFDKSMKLLLPFIILAVIGFIIPSTDTILHMLVTNMMSNLHYTDMDLYQQDMNRLVEFIKTVY